MCPSNFGALKCTHAMHCVGSDARAVSAAVVRIVRDIEPSVLCRAELCVCVCALAYVPSG